MHYKAAKPIDPLATLPQPNPHESYYFTATVAIHKITRWEGHVGEFYACNEQGPLTDKGEIATFSDPYQALEALRRSR